MTDGATDGISAGFLRQLIGGQFKDLRQAANLTLERAAGLTQISQSTIIRLENGKPGVKFTDAMVKNMLEIYGAPAESRSVLLSMTAQTREDKSRPWWHDYTEADLPDWFEPFVALEGDAEIIRQYQPLIVPGLLQTEAYADQMMRVPEGFLDEDEVKRRVTVRMKRQELLTRPRAPRLEVILDEAALHRISSSGERAGEQLQHLLKVSQQPNVDLRIIPWTAGIHGGMASTGGFSLLHFPTLPGTSTPLRAPLAYIESPTGAMYLTKPAEVDVYLRLIWTDLVEKALDQAATRDSITTALEGLTP